MSGGPILVAGNGMLAGAIEQWLVAGGAAVERCESGSAPGRQLDALQLQRAAVLVLASDDDAGNVDRALRVRRLHPALPLVVRLFDSALASYLAESVPRVVILSMSGVAAPVFADAARRALGSRPAPAGGRARTRRRSHRPGRFRLDPVLLWALLLLLLLVFPSALVFSHGLGLRYMDALYFVWTTVMTVGYGDIALKDAADGLKLFGMVLMLAGASFIAVLFALLSDWVLTRRLDLLRGRTRERGGGHVVIAGAGHLGFRIAELLAGSGRRLVIIERDVESRNASALSAAGHHVIVADATNEEILELAGVDAAAVVLAVTDADAVNLQIALRAQAQGVPVIMRLVSPELSAHVTQRGDGIAYSPVAAAAEVFSRAAMSAVAAG